MYKVKNFSIKLPNFYTKVFLNSQQSMSFEQYIASNLSKEDYENLEKHLSSSPHRKTKILRNPKIANNHEVLVFAQLLNCTAYQLFEEFGLGSNSLSDLEIENHKEFMELRDRTRHL